MVDQAARFLADELPVARLRSAAPGADAAKWPALARLGWFGIGLPLDAGGVGCGAAEEALICREAGRALLSPTATATMLAGHVVHRRGDRQRLHALLEGRQRIAVATPIGSPSLGDRSSGTFHLI